MKPANSSPYTEPRRNGRSFRPAPQDIAILIPAYQPTEALEMLIARLTDFDVPAILLVDDGSADRTIFDRLSLSHRVHILRHPQNMGKGVALKSGFRYFLNHLDHYKGVVTADATGRHSVEDILRVVRALAKAPQLAITGARSFPMTRVPRSVRGVPVRNLLANRLAAAMFRGVTGIPVTDAQTGLRALPTSLLRGLIDLPGCRYEYEMSMLLYIARTRHPLAEQPISMPYNPANGASHFRPIVDSLRIAGALLNQPVYVMRTPALPHAMESDADLSVSGSDRALRAK